MNIDEFKEQFDFAASCITDTSKNDAVRILVHVPPGYAGKSVILTVKEIGFNDKESMIYIEATEGS